MMLFFYTLVLFFVFQQKSTEMIELGWSVPGRVQAGQGVGLQLHVNNRAVGED